MDRVMFLAALAAVKAELKRKQPDPWRLYQALAALRQEVHRLQLRGVDPAPLVNPLEERAFVRLQGLAGNPTFEA